MLKSEVKVSIAILIVRNKLRVQPTLIFFKVQEVLDSNMELVVIVVQPQEEFVGFSAGLVV